MTKSDLTGALSHELQITPRDAAGVIATILDAMTSTLIQGENIEIRGFGSFTIKHYESFQSRNPKTGEKVVAKSKSRLSSNLEKSCESQLMKPAILGKLDEKGR